MNKLLLKVGLMMAFAPFGALAGAFSAMQFEVENVGVFTPLMLAIQEDDRQRINDLLTKGADVNELSGDRASALMLASAKGNIEVVKTLLEAGANVDQVSVSGNTALSYAAAEKRWDVVHVLLQRKADVSITPFSDANDNPPLINAVLANRKDVVVSLIRAGADISVRDFYMRRTALEHAVIYGFDDIVKELLNAGADAKSVLEKSWFDNRSALWHAKNKGHKSTVAIIKERLK